MNGKNEKTHLRRVALQAHRQGCVFGKGLIARFTPTLKPAFLFDESLFLQEIGSYFGDGFFFVVGLIVQLLHGVFVERAGEFIQ